MTDGFARVPARAAPIPAMVEETGDRRVGRLARIFVVAAAMDFHSGQKSPWLTKSRCISHPRSARPWKMASWADSVPPIDPRGLAIVRTRLSLMFLPQQG